MNKLEFEQQLKARKDEIEEMHGLVQKFADKIRSRQAHLKASMITSYRQGVIDLLEMLDQKAIEAKAKRDLTKKILNETRGSNEQSNGISEGNGHPIDSTRIYDPSGTYSIDSSGGSGRPGAKLFDPTY